MVAAYPVGERLPWEKIFLSVSSQGLHRVPQTAVPRCSSPCWKPATPCSGSGGNILAINEFILYRDESLKDSPAEQISVQAPGPSKVALHFTGREGFGLYHQISLILPVQETITHDSFAEAVCPV